MKLWILPQSKDPLRSEHVTPGSGELQHRSTHSFITGKDRASVGCYRRSRLRTQAHIHSSGESGIENAAFFFLILLFDTAQHSQTHSFIHSFIKGKRNRTYSHYFWYRCSTLQSTLKHTHSFIHHHGKSGNEPAASGCYLCSRSRIFSIIQLYHYIRKIGWGTVEPRFGISARYDSERLHCKTHRVLVEKSLPCRINYLFVFSGIGMNKQNQRYQQPTTGMENHRLLSSSWA